MIFTSVFFLPQACFRAFRISCYWAAALLARTWDPCGAGCLGAGPIRCASQHRVLEEMIIHRAKVQIVDLFSALYAQKVSQAAAQYLL